MEINIGNQDVNHFLVTILHTSVTEELIGRKLKPKSAIKELEFYIPVLRTPELTKDGVA